MHWKRMFLTVVGIGLILGWDTVSLAETATAPLNGVVSFQNVSAAADTLNVNAGSKTIKATDATKIQGSPNSRITVVTGQGTGIVHVADVVLRDGDSLYRVTGTYVEGGGGGGPSIWTADYNKGPRRLLAWVNDLFLENDKFLPKTSPEITGTLFVMMYGDDDGKTYTVNLSDTAGGGEAGLSTNQCSLGKVNGVWIQMGVVYLSGKTAGDTEILADCTDAGVTDAPPAPVTVVDISAVAVHANDTKTKDIPVNNKSNFVRVKGTGDIILSATVTPASDKVLNALSWTADGATITSPAVGTDKRTAKITTTNTFKAPLAVKVGKITCWEKGTAWSIWATVTVKMTGTTPANAVQFGTRYDGTENLGAKEYGAGLTKTAVGKVVPVAQIAPAEAKDVLKTDWAFKRDKYRRDFLDGRRFPGRWDNAWSDDTSSAHFQNLVPDGDAKIYDRDAPQILVPSGYDSYERNTNFRQRVEWNAVPCSDYAYWYWKGHAKKINATTVNITAKEVGIGNKTLPSSIDDAYYKYWVSGTITKNGQPMAGVTVSCGGKTATTAANGTYIVKECTPGTQAVTPTKAGETFTPASRNVVLNGTVVQNTNFTAN